jgi:hypothetical protein
MRRPPSTYTTASPVGDHVGLEPDAEIVPEHEDEPRHFSWRPLPLT